MAKKILMVCMGNICRSPIAEAVMNELLKQKGLSSEWLVHSAALVGYHSGELSDERALSVLQAHGILYTGRARVIQMNDFLEYDYIFGMDPDNIAELKKLSRNIKPKAQILLLGDYGLEESDRIIHDPYYFIGEAPFEEVYTKCFKACQSFIEQCG